MHCFRGPYFFGSKLSEAMLSETSVNWHPYSHIHLHVHTIHIHTYTHLDLSSSAGDIYDNMVHLYLPVTSIASFLFGILVSTTFFLCYICVSRRACKGKFMYPFGNSYQIATLSTSSTTNDDVIQAGLRPPTAIFLNAARSTAPSELCHVLSASSLTPHSVSLSKSESMSRRTSVATYENVPAPLKATEYMNVVPLERNVAYVTRKASTRAFH